MIRQTFCSLTPACWRKNPDYLSFAVVAHPIGKTDAASVAILAYTDIFDLKFAANDTTKTYGKSRLGIRRTHSF